SVNVNVASSTESTPETVTLGSTTPGLYTGTIVTALSGAAGGDGKLSVSNGDVITVTYNDAVPVGTSTATAAVVLNAPVVSGVGLVSRGSTEVTLGWTTSSQATSRVYYGTTTALGTTGALDPNLVASHQYVVGSLSPNTSYYFDVESTDIYGNTVRDDN